MTIKILLTILIGLSIIVACQELTFDQYQKIYDKLKNTISSGTPQQKLDAVVSVVKEFNSFNKQYSKELVDSYLNGIETMINDQCIENLGTAAKMVMNYLQKKDQKQSFIFSLLKLYQFKIRKNCPFLAHVSLSKLQNQAECFESAYRLSLVVQKLANDIISGNKPGTLQDIDTIITHLPDTLDLCGESTWANLIRKYLPLDCVHSVENFVALLPVLFHNYAHFEWLVKNYQMYLNAGIMLLAHCQIPILK